jgi:Glycosyl hydrolase family 9/Cellulase N-terminal ig-like domain
MKRRVLLAMFVCLISTAQFAQAQSMRVLTNHLGYEPSGPKRAVVQGKEGDSVAKFTVREYMTDKEVFSGAPLKTGPVRKWKDWHFWTVEFDGVTAEGVYIIECATGKGAIRSFPFMVRKNLLERHTLSDVIFYFKGQRSSGLLDKADRNAPFADQPGVRADLHGGWFDASGDYGKHLSHLSFSTYFNPQQITLTAWSLFKTYEQLEKRGDPNFRQYKRRLLDEAMYGADYLARSKNPKGSFYRSVTAPGPEKKAEDRRVSTAMTGFKIKQKKDENFSGHPGEDDRNESADEVGYRAGGGVAIAALAMAGGHKVSGDLSNAEYLRVAEEAFDNLEKNNLSLTNDGKENIVDDYCALLAATELYRTTKKDRYKAAADKRAKSLIGRLSSGGGYKNYWRADDDDRPFFHAVDAGYPVISLLYYAEIAGDGMKGEALDAVKKSLDFELGITGEVANPFGYSRQFVQNKAGVRRASFFYPHDAETAPWWQGENARLGSMATAARLAAKYFRDDPAFQNKLQTFALNQLNWILGLNPFDISMLHGVGRNNPDYMFFDSWEYKNAPGGIVNGVTAGFKDDEDIDFNLPVSVTGADNDWRWGEQWLPHAAWYMLAVAVGD